MTPYIQRIFAAIAITASLSLPAASGAADREESQTEQAEERAGEKAAPAGEKAAPKERRKPAETDTVSCRRDAHGLHGPERATFMTECLRTRR